MAVDSQALKASLSEPTVQDAETAQLLAAMEAVRNLPDGLSSDDESLQAAIDALATAKTAINDYLNG